MNAAGQVAQADIDAALCLPTPGEQRLRLVNLLSQELVSEMSEMVKIECFNLEMIYQP